MPIDKSSKRCIDAAEKAVAKAMLRLAKEKKKLTDARKRRKSCTKKKVKKKSSKKKASKRVAKKRVQLSIPSTTDNVSERVRATALRIGGGVKKRVRISDLRDALPDLPRADVDSALIHLQNSGDAVLYHLDNPAEMSDRDAKAAILVGGGNPRHLIYVENGAPAKVPPKGRKTAPTKASIERAYDRLREEKRSPNIVIADLVDESGASIPEVHRWIREQKGFTIGLGEPIYFTDRVRRAAFVVDGEPHAYVARIDPNAHSSEPSFENFSNDFRRAFKSIDKANGGTNWVSLVDMRKAMPRYPKPEFNAGLQAVRRERKFGLESFDGRHRTLTADEQDAAIFEDGRTLLFVRKRT